MPEGIRDRAWIAARIPHQGSMCLLDGVVAWDPASVRCTATSHTLADNPLRAQGRLAALCGIEYAAQAMAVHGALLAEAEPGGGARQRPRTGYLASVRKLVLQVERLDDIPAPLEVTAERISGEGASVLYAFVVSAAGHTLLSGRAAVILDAAAPGADAG
ncbi:hydroxymyristoyl-ACP dehydratase [Cupriavidus taiwanensis]|uniref:hydroxymyristoyl-ACP dehydratase n=1 Tax=Cupriavidus taiwanensis TaxID=164546 RepID=UPI000E0FFCB7|nr:hydroxymyristoyl-ACP dehydratase [Cupriavidus taiwanensis]SOY66188.1 putative beta-hydroxyacyl-acyl carrier protein (ACP)-dehydratase [Cupriavidus taiwanensis]SOY66193.1 putative beta-hydroxyacyl-acyl carrier protein (ACP)-dehydratase [Cupriavidus taiwanensis]SOY94265.1 putative beta-hydroxyacyl-acyl carrier protein (ACP)-dehydratase [Cupriavidus taiwanensis]SOZ70411.1 putative beta-hydroxyacyl-acyl carrier protein (ACP)-dehydratase [Cupriavidus taiwanensis]SOZ86126.1 putative beta-hydroxya